nr:outer membrane beta-barrel protein [uncultured Allomuricauda sp.]
MQHKTIKISIFFSTQLYLLLFLFSLTISFGQQSELSNGHFDGPYIGLTFGSQNIFGGAFIDDLDVLGQKSGLVVELSPGYRKQFLNDRLVVGVAFQFGLSDGDLTQTDTRNQMMVDYKNNSQFGYGIQLGVALGQKKGFLLYAFGNDTKRNFDITVTAINGLSFTQKDGQRFGRYGLGLEVPVYKKININANVGRVSVDYGDLETNIDVDDKTDFNLGITYQF